MTEKKPETQINRAWFRLFMHFLCEPEGSRIRFWDVTKDALFYIRFEEPKSLTNPLQQGTSLEVKIRPGMAVAGHEEDHKQYLLERFTSDLTKAGWF